MNIEDLARLLDIADLDARLAAVEQRLEEVLAQGTNGLGAASLRVMKGGGKRLRPIFTVAAAQLADVFDDRVVSGAVAIELVQVGSLVHDDVFEDAATRRGVPTINAVEGFNIAVMAGDFILAKAGEEAVQVSTDAGQMLAATVIRLCEGQLAEMGDQFNPGRTVDAYLGSIRAKTAVLFAAACKMGGMCGGLGAGDLERLVAFGNSFGMAFQLLDDVLDFTADPVKLGKPVGIDVATGVYTLPVLSTLTRSGGDQVAELLRRHQPDDLVAVREAVLQSGAIDETLELARRHASEASVVIQPISDGLARLPSAYLHWALDHFTDPLCTRSEFGRL